MYEKTIQQLAERAPNLVFPERGFRITGRAVPVDGGEVDLLAVDPQGQEWVIELKRDRLQPGCVRQVLGYRDRLQSWYPDRALRPMVAGPATSDATSAEARRHGVEVFLFDMTALQALAQRLGISDRAARPRRGGTPARPSEPRGPARARAADPAVEAHLRMLDVAFPPGSVVADAGSEVLLAYWRAACPNAPAYLQDLVASVCQEVLSATSGLALSNRAKHWTTIRWPDGRLAAAVNADAARVKFDFWLPDDLASAFVADGMGRVDMARVDGSWVQVKDLRSPERARAAVAWFERGLAAWN